MDEMDIWDEDDYTVDLDNDPYYDEADNDDESDIWDVYPYNVQKH